MPEDVVVEEGETIEEDSKFLYQATSDISNIPLSLGDWYHKKITAKTKISDVTTKEWKQQPDHTSHKWTKIDNFGDLSSDKHTYIYQGDKEINDVFLKEFTNEVTANKRFLDFLLEILSIAEYLEYGQEEEIIKIKSLYKDLIFKVGNFFNLYINKELEYGKNVGNINNVYLSIVEKLEEKVILSPSLTGDKIKILCDSIYSGSIDENTADLTIGVHGSVLYKIIKFYIYRKNYQIREKLLIKIFRTNEEDKLKNYNSLNFTEYSEISTEVWFTKSIRDILLTLAPDDINIAINLEKIKLKLKIDDYNDVINQDINDNDIREILDAITDIDELEYNDELVVSAKDEFAEKISKKQKDVKLVVDAINMLSENKKTFFNKQRDILLELLDKSTSSEIIFIKDLTMWEFIAFFYLKDITYNFISNDIESLSVMEEL